MGIFIIEIATGGLSTDYKVTPLPDGSYDIIKENQRIGNIYRQIANQKETWASHDEHLDEELLQALGKAIEHAVVERS